MKNTILDYYVAEVSDTQSLSKQHKMLLRSGIVSPLANGLQAWMPLGLQLKRNIISICRQEMLNIGCQEFELPGIIPSSIYDISGRGETFSKGIYHTEGHYLAPTHEETSLLTISKFLSSYKDLPIHLLQFTDKYRKETRPKGLLLRANSFVMQDSYHFCTTQEESSNIYQKTKKAYQNIFQRLNIPCVFACADASSMKGDSSEEVHYLSDLGDDYVAVSDQGYVANIDVAPIRSQNLQQNFAKLYFQTPLGFVEARIPRARRINTYKLAQALQINEDLLTAVGQPELQREVKIVLSDRNLVRTKDVTHYEDIVVVEKGDTAPDGGLYHVHKSLEIAHIFDLGQYYPLFFNVQVHDANNNRNFVYMGSYGIGISRLISVILDLYSTDKNINWPVEVRPIKNVVFIPQKRDTADIEAAKKLCSIANQQGKDASFYEKPHSYEKALKICQLKGCPNIVVVSGYNQSYKLHRINQPTVKGHLDDLIL